MENVPRETLRATQLTAALRRFLPDISPTICDFFSLHYSMLCRWNSTHNITRITEPAESALLHYIDSLLPLRAIEQPTTVVDIGSGTGLPGLAAAAWWPAARVVLVESSAKKISFLRSFRAHVDRPGIEVLAGRCESIPPQSADLVLIRATFRWPEIPALAARHLARHGRLLAYVGRSAPTQSEWEKAVVEAHLVAAEVQQYNLPGDEHVRHAASARKE